MHASSLAWRCIITKQTEWHDTDERIHTQSYQGIWLQHWTLRHDTVSKELLRINRAASRSIKILWRFLTASLRCYFMRPRGIAWIYCGLSVCQETVGVRPRQCWYGVHDRRRWSRSTPKLGWPSVLRRPPRQEKSYQWCNVIWARRTTMLVHQA
jgi:hypothetical protein